MTTAVPKRFLRSLQVLESLKFAPANMRLHWLALHDLPDAELQQAVARAARECEEFPSPRMLRAFVTEARRALESIPQYPETRETVIAPQRFTLPDGTPVTVTREWKYYCETCNDSGRMSFWCGAEAPMKPWYLPRHCGRTREHGSHEWVGLCACAATNRDVPDYIKAQAQRPGPEEGVE